MPRPDPKFTRDALERLDAFLLDHASETASLSVGVCAREGEDWDFSLGSLRDIAWAARAAPDLYEALKALLHECGEAGFFEARDYGWPKKIAAARAALARADGAGQ